MRKTLAVRVARTSALESQNRGLSTGFQVVTYTTAMSACSHWQAVLQLLRELGTKANAFAYTTAIKVGLIKGV